uniref:Protein kinase domain-containing protein n=1 Tax=viral metagenome TaxID=1070528 RepID=A0A6C0HHH5_9ZZZZ
MSISSVVGEGAYGCIHKPSLTCKGSKIQNYKNKVSKVLQREKAKLELDEYSSIAKADSTREYYLGTPVECSVDNTPTNIQSIEKCKNGTDLLKKLDDLSLLIMDDGGINLKEYADLMETWSATPEHVEQTERFIIELHRIFHGISVFIEKGILHYDMKPQNIVYNSEKERMNIIDFGLTISLKDKLADIESSENNMARYHWSYPFESFFLNKDKYEKYAEMSQTEKAEYYQSILRKITDESTDESKAFKTFFSFVLDETPDSTGFKEHMAGFYQTFVVEMTMKNYPMFIKKSVSSIDVYGLGITLLYVLRQTRRLLKDKLYTDLYNLGINMVNADLAKRITATAALSQYETILTENSIMSKYRISFANHKIVQGEPIPEKIEQSIESIKIDDIIIPPNKLNEHAVSINLQPTKKLISEKSAKKRKAKKSKKTAKKRAPKRRTLSKPKKMQTQILE